MSRWIDADAIIEKKWQAESEACFYALEDVVSVTDIEEAPSIDIVRCRECKYAHMTYDGECKYCDKWSLEDSLYLDGDFFCSYGEREGE